MIRWIAIAALGGLVAALVVPSRDVPARPRLSPKLGRALLNNLTARAGLDDNWRLFFEALAKSESRWNPHASNDSSGEVAAALIAYTRNRKRYAGCGWPVSRYIHPGSGGFLGIIPANGLAVFWGTVLQCVDPHIVLEPAANVVMAMGYARRLMRWKQFKANPTWHNLWRGWDNPAAMGPGARRQKFERILGELGHPSSFADRQVTSLGSFDALAMLVHLRRGAVVA